VNNNKFKNAKKETNSFEKKGIKTKVKKEELV
jgi:hypothetical protein